MARIGSKTSEEKLKLLEAALPGPLDEKLAAAFRTSRPLEDRPSLVQCKHCRRPVEQSAAANHIRACLDKKQFKLKKKKEAKEAKDAAARRERGEKVSDGGDDDGSEKGRDGKGGDDGDGRKGKKRKVNGEAEKTSKTKKKKDEPKSKPTKVKGPVDVERQCGVLLPNGQQCARSLTCKSHSMGAKRAVPGRSKPYDLLLAAYQKQNQAKQQRKFHRLTMMVTDAVEVMDRVLIVLFLLQEPQSTRTPLSKTTLNLRTARLTRKKSATPSWLPSVELTLSLSPPRLSSCHGRNISTCG